MKKYSNLIGFIVAVVLTYLIFSIITQNGSIFIDGILSSFDSWFFTAKLLTEMTILILIVTAMLILKKVGIFDVASPGKFLLGLLAIYLSTYYIGGSPIVKIIIGYFIGLFVIFSLSILILILKIKFKVNEVAFGLMFNFCSIFIYKTVMGIAPSSISWMDKLGELTQLGRITNFTSSGFEEITIFLIPAILIPILIWLFFKYSPWGFKIIIVGESKELAKSLGINLSKKYFIAVTLSSIILSLALLAQLFSVLSGQLQKEIISTPSIVWTGIVVSLMVTINPITTFLYSFVFALIYRSSTYIQATAGIDARSIEMATGILMMSISVIPYFIKNFEKQIGLILLNKNIFKKVKRRKT